MKRYNNIPVWGDPIDPGALKQIEVCAQNAAAVALMADHHKGYAVPIGGVVAYKDKISPSGVGFDIACGNMAVLTDAHIGDIKQSMSSIADTIFSTIAFGVGRKNDERVEHPIFEDAAFRDDRFLTSLRPMAEKQLGTVGSGNHYVDVFVDRSERVWVGVHFGSRGFGHKIATHFLEQGGAKDGMDVEPLVIDVHSALGSDYLRAMELAGRYAYAGREWVCHKVVEILGAAVLDTVHNHHNYAWNEEHGGENLWVVRKGATPAFPGQRGFVGGSMGDISVILRGKEHALSKESLYSTVHGAGRVMSRTAAKGRFERDNRGKKQRQAGLVRHDAMIKWIEDAGVTLRGADVDEAPQCYKRIEDVLAQHDETIVIEEVLNPVIVCMAGENTIDPYKD